MCQFFLSASGSTKGGGVVVPQFHQTGTGTSAPAQVLYPTGARQYPAIAPVPSPSNSSAPAPAADPPVVLTSGMKRKAQKKAYFQAQKVLKRDQAGVAVLEENNKKANLDEENTTTSGDVGEVFGP